MRFIPLAVLMSLPLPALAQDVSSCINSENSAACILDAVETDIAALPELEKFSMTMGILRARQDLGIAQDLDAAVVEIDRIGQKHSDAFETFRYEKRLGTALALDGQFERALEMASQRSGDSVIVETVMKIIADQDADRALELIDTVQIREMFGDGQKSLVTEFPSTYQRLRMYIGAVLSKQGDQDGDALIRDALANVSQDMSDRNYLQYIMSNLLNDYSEASRLDVGGRMFAEYGSLSDKQTRYWAVAGLVDQNKNDLAYVLARSAPSKAARAAMLSDLVLLDEQMDEAETREIVAEVLQLAADLPASDETLDVFGSMSLAAAKLGDVATARTLYAKIETTLADMKAADIESEAYLPLVFAQREIAWAAQEAGDVALYEQELAVLRDMNPEIANFMTGGSARILWQRGEREQAVAELEKVTDKNIRRDMTLSLVPEYSPF